MTDQHLGLDALADLLVGDGSVADVYHVAGCAPCGKALAELDAAQAGVAAALAARPLPPAPAALRERVSAAFRAEQPLSGRDHGYERVASVAATATARIPPLRRANVQRAWLPAAAAVALVLAGGLGLSLLTRGEADQTQKAGTTDGSGDRSATADDGDLLAGVQLNQSGGDYAAPGALAQALSAVLAGTAPPGSVPRAVPGAVPGSPAAPGAARSPAPPREGSDFPGLERLREPEGLASCLAALLPPGDTPPRPLAIDYAAYAGQPALVVVLTATDASKVDVFIVAPDCGQGSASTLFFARLNRPR